MITQDSILISKLAEHFRSGNSVQNEAWEMLQEVGLPHKKSEAYKYTPISSVLDKHISFSVTGKASTLELYKEQGNHLVIRNGVFSAEESTIQSNLEVSVREVTKSKHDPFSLLNTAFCSEELALTITGSQSPIFVYHVNEHGFVNSRIKVHVNANAEVSIIEKTYNGATTFSNSYIEFEVAENASANLTKLQNYLPSSIAHETIIANQKRDSRFHASTYSFSGKLIRNNLTINLDGENCEGHMSGLYLLDGSSHVDNNTSVDHLKPNSYSNELYKGILDEKSNAVFNGKIYVRQDAQKTNAFQSNNNILLSDNATINTKPQLEIWADDVKCSHGCTTGQLDEDAIFYLRARGISERDAKAMILNAFVKDTFAHIKSDEVLSELENLISQKLS